MESQSQNIEALFSGFIQDIRILVKKELELARLEFSQNLNVLKRNLLVAVMGGCIVQWGIIGLLAAAAVGLGHRISLIWALLLIGTAVMLTGGLITWAAIRNIRKQTLLPAQAIEALRMNAGKADNESNL